MSNLYSQRVFTEHPIHVWSLEETEIESMTKFAYNYDLNVGVGEKTTNINGYWSNSMSSNNTQKVTGPKHDIFYVAKDQLFEDTGTALCYQDTGFCTYQDLECSRTEPKELPPPGCEDDTTFCEDGYSKYGEMYTKTDYSPWFFNTYNGLNSVCLPSPFKDGGYWREGMPMVIGSNGATTLNPFRNNSEVRQKDLIPSLILDGAGFLSQQGQYASYTFEFWMRISDSSVEPLRIFGPFEENTKDGLWLKDGMLIYVVGSSAIASFDLGAIDAPTLIHLTYTSAEISLMINGEIVASTPIAADEELELAFTRYLAFYTYEELGKFEIDVPSVSGYLIPEFAAKRRFIWGEATEEIEVINESFLGETIMSDYSSTNTFGSLAYPRNMFWESGQSENVIVTNDKITFEKKPLPVVNFASGGTKEEWFKALDKGEWGGEEPSFDFDDTVNGFDMGDFRYVRFDYLSNFVSDLRGLYVDFQVQSGDVFRLTSTSYPSRSVLGYVKNNEFCIDYRDTSVSFSQQIYTSESTESTSDIGSRRFRLYFDLKALFQDSFGNVQVPPSLQDVAPQLQAMLSDTSTLNLVLGSENQVQYDGAGYCFPNNFCDYDTLAESWCQDGEDDKSNCDSFKNYDHLAENKSESCGPGGLTYPPYLDAEDNLYDNLAYCASPGFVGQIYSVGFSGEQNHKLAGLGGGRGEVVYRVPETLKENYNILTYTWKPVVGLISFKDDVYSKSYWEDYFPLTSMASEVDGRFELDSIQFNSSQPRHLLDISVVVNEINQDNLVPFETDEHCTDCGNVLCAVYVGGLCSYRILKCSACGCEVPPDTPERLYIDKLADLKPPNYKTYRDVRGNCEYLAPVNSAVTLVKLWKNDEAYAYENVSSGISRPPPGRVSQYPFAYELDNNTIDISQDVATTNTALYQVVDETNIVIDELNELGEDLENYKIGVYVELTSRGNTVEPVTLSQLEFSAYSKNFKEDEEESITYSEYEDNAPIKSKVGKDVIPQDTKGFRINKKSFPYLYRSRGSGYISDYKEDQSTRVMPTLGGYIAPVNKVVHSVQFFVRRSEKVLIDKDASLLRFVTENTLGSSGIQESIDASLTVGSNEVIGEVWFTDTFEGNLDYELVHNGKTVDRIFIKPNEWHCISLVFNRAVAIDYIDLGQDYVFDNISYFLDETRAGENCPDGTYFCTYLSLAYACNNPLCMSSICDYEELRDGSSLDIESGKQNEYTDMIDPCGGNLVMFDEEVAFYTNPHTMNAATIEESDDYMGRVYRTYVSTDRFVFEGSQPLSLSQDTVVMNSNDLSVVEEHKK